MYLESNFASSKGRARGNWVLFWYLQALSISCFAPFQAIIILVKFVIPGKQNLHLRKQKAVTNLFCLISLRPSLMKILRRATINHCRAQNVIWFPPEAHFGNLELKSSSSSKVYHHNQLESSMNLSFAHFFCHLLSVWLSELVHSSLLGSNSTSRDGKE